MADAHQAIKVVARRTGLSAHVIRIWEKRYGAVEPERTETKRRLYSDEQIERLEPASRNHAERTQHRPRREAADGETARAGQGIAA